MPRPPEVRAYTMTYDLGFAPNPFSDICTLATCAARTRKAAQIGDYVIGTGSYQKPAQAGRAIYVMRVTDILEFDKYWQHPDFQPKKPDMRGSRVRRYGDNIYSWNTKENRWNQADSRHSLPGGVLSEEDLRRDTNVTRKVLISNNFTYWGRNAAALPAQLAVFAKKGVRDKQKFDRGDIDKFIAWADPLLGQGRIGLPFDWGR